MLIAIAGGASSGKVGNFGEPTMISNFLVQVNIKVWALQIEVCSLIEEKFATKADTNVSVLVSVGTMDRERHKAIGIYLLGNWLLSESSQLLSRTQ